MQTSNLFWDFKRVCLHNQIRKFLQIFIHVIWKLSHSCLLKNNPKTTWCSTPSLKLPTMFDCNHFTVDLAKPQIHTCNNWIWRKYKELKTIYHIVKVSPRMFRMLFVEGLDTLEVITYDEFIIDSLVCMFLYRWLTCSNEEFHVSACPFHDLKTRVNNGLFVILMLQILLL